MSERLMQRAALRQRLRRMTQTAMLCPVCSQLARHYGILVADTHSALVPCSDDCAARWAVALMEKDEGTV